MYCSRAAIAGSMCFPGSYELTGFHVVHETSVRLAPLGFPLVPTNVLKHLGPSKRCTRFTLLAERVICSGSDLRFDHRTVRSKVIGDRGTRGHALPRGMSPLGT